MKNIDAKIIADSVTLGGLRITTFELTYPRYIHSEFMTHRLFSRNAASSRAIPFEKVLEQVKTNPAHPEEWGVNKPGMQASENLEGHEKATAEWAWNQAAKSAAEKAILLNELGLHKQIVNRVLEPFVHMKTVLTATDFNNWYWLRDHRDAQPEIRILAGIMKDLHEISLPRILSSGEWHTPYYLEGCWHQDSQATLEKALSISASCCAQVSYRKNDDSLEKAQSLCKRLLGGGNGPVHASPFEHQATPISIFSFSPSKWESGVTHMDRDHNLWSGNFKGWIQNRQLIPNHDMKG